VNLLGAEAFLPGSQIDVRPVRDFDAYLGKTMEFKVVKTNPANGNVVVSHKALVEKDLQAQREQILDSLEVGQILEGQVKNIVDFGVFIDLGGVDGLLHITDLSWGRVGHPSEVVELDQKLNIVVLNYEKERQRISLGLKQLLPHPWENIEERFAENQVVQGRVVSITDYGAFVELEKGIEGLVHISEMSYTEHIKHPTQKVQLGQIVDVKILNIDTEEKKISLGMKQLEPDPWERILEKYSVGQTTNGIVRNITSFGAFVELEPGIDGLVHVSDLSWTKRVKHPSEVVKKGQELEIMVLDIDVVNRRLSLGHKQVQTDPWQQYATAYAEDTQTTAKVTEVTQDGLRVELPLEAPGFIPASQLERGNAFAYEEGEELALLVIRLDKQNRDIILSETARRRAAERAEKFAERQEKSKQLQEERREVQQFQSKETQARGPATLGELTGLEALKAKMEAQEAEAATEQGASEQPPVGEAASEAQSKTVEAEQPEEEAPPVTTGKASTALEDQVGMGNRGSIGTDPDEVATPSDAGDPTEPPAEQSQRGEEGGDYPPAEKSQAAHKSGEMPQTGVAGQAEDATDDETPATDAALQPSGDAQTETVADADVPEVLEQPKDEAVQELTDTDEEDEGAEAEMGKADATVTGDDAEDVADKAS
ncbi:MAG: S1 RNA-binding domain-containing protein, partial [Rhodothermales bacterium]|nr:S1 RNA-binding domain-containing protein [Rhodothermales bacterium]